MRSSCPSVASVVGMERYAPTSIALNGRNRLPANVGYRPEEIERGDRIAQQCASHRVGQPQVLGPQRPTQSPRRIVGRGPELLGDREDVGLAVVEEPRRLMFVDPVDKKASSTIIVLLCT